MPRTANENGITDALLIIEVLKQIPIRRLITVAEIQNNLAASGYKLETRRLQRMLKNMCEHLDPLITCDKTSKPYGYQQKVPDSSISAMHLRPQECLMLLLFKENLKYQLPAPLVKSLQNLFDAAENTFKRPTTTYHNKEWLQKVAFVSGTVPMLPPKITNRVFDAVSEALYLDKKLHVKFENSKGTTTEADVSPLGLVQQEHRLYLVCKFDKYDNIRHLALHRIQTATLVDLEAERPADFSLDRYIKERHFNYSNGRHIRLILEFTNHETARNMQETPFNRTQKLEKIDDETWRLEAVVDDTVQLDGWIAAWHDIAGIKKVEKITIEGESDK